MDLIIGRRQGVACFMICFCMIGIFIRSTVSIKPQYLSTYITTYPSGYLGGITVKGHICFTIISFSFSVKSNTCLVMEVKVYKAYRPRTVKEDIIKELKNKNWMKEAECVQNKEYIECVYDIFFVYLIISFPYIF